MKKRYQIGTVLFCTALAGYGLAPSEYLKYRWKKRSRKRSREGGKGKQLYLTFDDGPDKTYTNQLLDLLKQYHIKASFFVMAKAARENPDLIQRMRQDGHYIGIHSVRHENALFGGKGFVRRDLEESIETLKNLGCEVCAYRPPWGHLNLWTLYYCQRMKLKLSFWDVMANDWSARETAVSIENKVLQRVFPGAVICLHDGRGKDHAPGRTVEALRRALPVLLKRGYSFETMEVYQW